MTMESWIIICSDYPLNGGNISYRSNIYQFS